MYNLNSYNIMEIYFTLLKDDDNDDDDWATHIPIVRLRVRKQMTSPKDTNKE